MYIVDALLCVRFFLPIWSIFLEFFLRFGEELSGPILNVKQPRQRHHRQKNYFIK